MVHLKNTTLKIYFNICYSKIVQLLKNDCVRICLLIITVFVISPLFIFYLSKTYSSKYDGHIDRSIKVLKSFFRSSNAINDIKFSGCTNFDCSFICANTTNVNNDLLNILHENNCTSIDNIHIERQYFLNATLRKNWLLVNYTLHDLQILSSNIEIIENEAFNTEIYTETFSLTIQNSKLYKLTAGILLGLSQLEYLTIISGISDINRGFFQPVRTSLHFLKLNQMTNKIKFNNIFGISNMTNLIHLDVSSNNFHHIINGEIFKQLPVLRLLNLSNSKITSISENAFDYVIDSLKFLDLSYNHLKRINNLNNILINRQVYIYLRENQWNCNCYLESMAKTFIEYKDMFMDIPYCKLPHKFYGEMINTIEYNDCKNNSNSSDIEQFDSSSKPTRTTTFEISTTTDNDYLIGTDFTEPSKNIPNSEVTTTAAYIIPNKNKTFPNTLLPKIKRFFRLTCVSQTSALDDLAENFINQSIPASNTPSYTDIFQQISILPPFYEFNLELINNNSVLITIEKFNDNLSILWYSDPENDAEMINSINNNNNNDIEYGCQYHNEHNKTILIENLKDNNSYTFCLIPDGDENITPFNCLPFYIPEILIQNNTKLEHITTWISNDDKNFTVAIICIILSISMFSGGIIAYIILKYNPDLLEGSKHVLVVKKSCDDEKSITKNLSIISEPSSGFCNNFITDNNQYYDSKNRVSLIPLTTRDIIDTDSAYETPVDLDFDDTDYMEHINNDLKFSPPSLPDRFNEHIYGTIDPPIVHYKRSI